MEILSPRHNVTLAKTLPEQRHLLTRNKETVLTKLKVLLGLDCSEEVRNQFPVGRLVTVKNELGQDMHMEVVGYHQGSVLCVGHNGERTIAARFTGKELETELHKLPAIAKYDSHEHSNTYSWCVEGDKVSTYPKAGEIRNIHIHKISPSGTYALSTIEHLSDREQDHLEGPAWHRIADLHNMVYA